MKGDQGGQRPSKGVSVCRPRVIEGVFESELKERGGRVSTLTCVRDSRRGIRDSRDRRLLLHRDLTLYPRRLLGIDRMSQSMVENSQVEANSQAVQQ
jgi:hypothetical protein